MTESTYGFVEKLVGGVLVLLNAFVWPKWLEVNGWIKFAAVIFLLVTIVRFVKNKIGKMKSAPAVAPVAATPTPAKASK